MIIETLTRTGWTPYPMPVEMIGKVLVCKTTGKIFSAPMWRDQAKPITRCRHKTLVSCTRPKRPTKPTTIANKAKLLAKSPIVKAHRKAQTCRAPKRALAGPFERSELPLAHKMLAAHPGKKLQQHGTAWWIV